MGRAAKVQAEQLNLALTEHLNTMHETFQVLEDTPVSSCGKVSWNEVIKMGDQVSKQATVVGMLWNGGMPEAKHLKENMETYFNFVQGFLFLAHGSKVGAGPTLSSCVDVAAKQVVDSSFMLFKDSISSYGSLSKDQKISIPSLVGAVWEACSALKKVPTTNITAIGRAITQVAVSMKDVLREMKELKPASADSTGEALYEDSVKEESGVQDSENSSAGDLGNDLSPEEMKITQSAIIVVSEMLVVMKELIRSITGLLKRESPEDSNDSVESLEKLLKLCQEIGIQIDELGACLYPPQEFPAMKAIVAKISRFIDEMQVEVRNLKGTFEAFSEACFGLQSSLSGMESGLGCSSITELAADVENLVVGN